MILEPIKIQQDTLFSMCAMCVSDRSGGQIALFIIIFSLVLLGIINWVWKKYLKNSKQISTEK